MKRIAALFLVLTMLLCFAACGSTIGESKEATLNETQATQTRQPTSGEILGDQLGEPTDPTDDDNTQPAVPDAPEDPKDPEGSEQEPDDEFTIVGKWKVYNEDEYYSFSDDLTGYHYFREGGTWYGIYVYEKYDCIIDDDFLYLTLWVDGEFDSSVRYQMSEYDENGRTGILLSDGYLHDGEQYHVLNDIVLLPCDRIPKDAEIEWVEVENFSIIGKWSEGTYKIYDQYYEFFADGTVDFYHHPGDNFYSMEEINYALFGNVVYLYDDEYNMSRYEITAYQYGNFYALRLYGGDYLNGEYGLMEEIFLFPSDIVPDV